METLLLPFSPRYIILTICAVVTALLVGVGIFDAKVKVWELLSIPIVIFGALTLLGIRDRPIVLKRFVDGAEGQAFYQKRAPSNTPGSRR